MSCRTRLRSLSLPVVSLALWLAALPAHALTLEALADHLAAQGDVAGRFEQTRYLADLDTQIDGRGHYRFEQGDRVVWALESPVQETMELSSQGIQRNGQPVKSDPAGVATLIMQLLNGQLAALSDRFRVTLEGDQKNWHARLIPRQQALASYLESIDMRGNDRLEQVHMAMADGDRLDIHLLPPEDGSLAAGNSTRQAP